MENGKYLNYACDANGDLNVLFQYVFAGWDQINSKSAFRTIMPQMSYNGFFTLNSNTPKVLYFENETNKNFSFLAMTSCDDELRRNKLYKLYLESNEVLEPEGWIFQSPNCFDNENCSGWFNLERFTNGKFLVLWVNSSNCMLGIAIYDKNFRLLKQQLTVIDSAVSSSIYNSAILDENHFVFFTGDCAVIGYSVEISPNLDFIFSKTIILNSSLCVRSQGSCQEEHFFAILKDPLGFVVVTRFWFQKFDFFGNQRNELQIIRDFLLCFFEAPISSSSGILGDGRFITTYPTNSSANLSIFFNVFSIMIYIEGDENIHQIAEVPDIL